MAAWRCEISLRVLKNEISSTRDEKFRISKRPCNINSNEILKHFTKGIERSDFICNHSNSDLFTCEEVMFSRESSLGIS